MSDVLIAILIAPIIGGLVAGCICSFYYSEPTLSFGKHFKPKRHFLYEKCSKCGKKLKHYHWFLGKGDFMACDVDYHGNTEWYCEGCNNEINKDTPYVPPHI